MTTWLLQQINDNLESLRAGNGMKSTLMVDEERHFMWNLIFIARMGGCDCIQDATKFVRSSHSTAFS